MRPTPVAAGFQCCGPGRVSRAANPGSSAIAKRDTLRAIPLAVADLTNSRREICILLHLVVDAIGYYAPSHSSKAGHDPKRKPACLRDIPFKTLATGRSALPSPSGAATETIARTAALGSTVNASTESIAGFAWTPHQQLRKWQVHPNNLENQPSHIAVAVTVVWWGAWAKPDSGRWIRRGTNHRHEDSSPSRTTRA